MRNIYQFLLSTPLKKQWQKIGLKKRAGVIIPLFFVWSKKSFGIGEIRDIRLLIDFCQKAGFSILQLLPLQDTGFNSSPYSLQSGFALNPIYLSLDDLIGIEKKIIEKVKNKIGKNFKKSERVNYQKIKALKLKILWEIFLKSDGIKSVDFQKFKEKNSFWLNDYSLFRLLKEKFKERKWLDWPEEFKNYRKKILNKLAKQNSKKIEFQQWLQWQLFSQLKKIKEYAKEKEILLCGDFCWLMARDSADVWAKKKYFELSFDVGTPPSLPKKDKGQRWGFPPLNWERIIKDNFFYLKARLKYLENFYHLIRIDHVLGIFRIWKMPLTKEEGWFEPKEKKKWGERGRKILLKIIKSSEMLPIAEDLGLVFPECLEVLKKLGILGMKVQRWQKNWQKKVFIQPKDYPPFSVATLSTHDTSNWLTWWEKEASKLEREQLLKIILGKKKKVSFKKLIEKNLEIINASKSIFCILLLSEWLFLTDILKGNPAKYTFNRPGTVSPKNWSIKMPISLEELLENPLYSKIRKILEKTGRA